jgi:hypothetical protein
MTEMLDGDEAFGKAAWHFEEQSGNLELEELEKQQEREREMRESAFHER